MDLVKCSKCYDTLTDNVLEYYKNNFFTDKECEKWTKIKFGAYGGYLCEKHLLQCSKCKKNLTKREIDLYHDVHDNINMQTLFLSNKGYLCDLCIHKCSKCYQSLTEEELQYFNENTTSGISETLLVCEGYVCRKHWCECMPESTPWSYISSCEICGDNYICKNCKHHAKSGLMICEECNDRLKNRDK